MALTVLILIIILGAMLGEKGKVYREERRQAAVRGHESERRERILDNKPLTKEQIDQMQYDAKEEEYRKDLQKQGYSDELITTILPTLMNDGK